MGETSDLQQCEVAFYGPENTPYEGGVFFLTINFPEDYPVRPMSCSFKTRIFHPNVSEDGKMCLSMLGNEWTTKTTLNDLIEQIVAMLKKPEVERSVSIEATKLYEENRRAFD